MDTHQFVQKARKSISKKLISLRHDLYIFIILIFLSILGVGIADAFEIAAHWYWAAMVPVFFGACLYLEWQAIKQSGADARQVFFRQVLHWLGALASIFLAFFLREIGSLDNQTTGLILLLLLAQATFLAGVYTGWLFRLLGMFLGLCLILVAYMEHYVGVLIATAAVMIVLYHYLTKSIDGIASEDE